jgi:Protein of unknown function (DUF1572)
MLDWIEATQREFERYRALAERSFSQVDDAEFFAASDSESNSIAVIAKHVGGNLRSRWTDFLTTDGEKPDRDRESEFIAQPDRPALMEIWTSGWTAVLGTLHSLRAEDLEKTITIRGEPHSVPQAMQRSLSHAAYHVGQIVVLARQFRAADWQSLSVPRGESAAFNNVMRERHKTR